MKALLTAAIVPVFAGFLCAQTSEQTTRTETKTTTTTNNYSGVLMDAGCVTKNTVHKETTTNSSESGNSTRTETTRETVSCPVTTTTTAFVLQTPEGKFVRFDPSSNTKFVETIKSNKEWNREMNDRAPIKVQVVGTPDGDYVVVKSFQ